MKTIDAVSIEHHFKFNTFPEILDVCNLCMRCNFQWNGRRIYAGSTVMTMIQWSSVNTWEGRGSGPRCCLSVTSFSDVNGFEVMTLESVVSIHCFLYLLLFWVSAKDPHHDQCHRHEHGTHLDCTIEYFSRKILNFHQFFKFRKPIDRFKDWLIVKNEIVQSSRFD